MDKWLHPFPTISATIAIVIQCIHHCVYFKCSSFILCVRLMFRNVKFKWPGIFSNASPIFMENYKTPETITGTQQNENKRWRINKNSEEMLTLHALNWIFNAIKWKYTPKTILFGCADVSSFFGTTKTFGC